MHQSDPVQAHSGAPGGASAPWRPDPKPPGTTGPHHSADPRAASWWPGSAHDVAGLVTLQTPPEAFQAMQDGRRPFDLCPGDLGLEVGQVVHLLEWCPTPYARCRAGHRGHRSDHPACGATGRSLLMRVTYVLAAGPAAMLPGLVAVGLAAVDGPPSAQDLDRLVRAIAPEHVGASVDEAIDQVRAQGLLADDHGRLVDQVGQLVRRLDVMRQLAGQAIAALAATGHEPNCPAGMFGDGGCAGACSCQASALIVRLAAMIGAGEVDPCSGSATNIETARAGLRWLNAWGGDHEATAAAALAIAAADTAAVQAAADLGQEGAATVAALGAA